MENFMKTASKVCMVFFVSICFFSGTVFAEKQKEIVDVKYTKAKIRTLEKDFENYKKTIEMLSNDNVTMSNQIKGWEEEYKQGVGLRKRYTSQIKELMNQKKINTDFEIKAKLENEIDDLNKRRNLVNRKIANLANLVNVKHYTIKQNNKKIKVAQSEADYCKTNIAYLKKLLEETEEFNTGVDKVFEENKKLKQDAEAFLNQ